MCGEEVALFFFLCVLLPRLVYLVVGERNNKQEQLAHTNLPALPPVAQPPTLKLGLMSDYYSHHGQLISLRSLGKWSLPLLAAFAAGAVGYAIVNELVILGRKTAASSSKANPSIERRAGKAWSGERVGRGDGNSHSIDGPDGKLQHSHSTQGNHSDANSSRAPAICKGVEELIGNTKIVELTSLSRATGCTILAKCEMLNPGGSSKDRIALNIILEGEKQGLLKKGGTIYEGTAGSTGISLALLANARGYKCVIVMADDMAMEKETMLRTLGAEVRRVKAVSIVHRDHFCNVAKRMAEEDPLGFYANQFENLANARAHYETTGKEIWEQTGGQVDAFVMAAGTGGTISGVGQYLRHMNNRVRVALIDPPGSTLYHKVKSGVTYTRQQSEKALLRNRYDTITEGIGIDRLVRNFDVGISYITDAFQGLDQEAVSMAYYMIMHEGIFIGSSSAMNIAGAVKMARLLGPGHTIVTCMCDQGHRSMSKLYNKAFLDAWGLERPETTTTLDAAQGEQNGASDVSDPMDLSFVL